MSLFNYALDTRYPDRYSRDKGWVRVLPIHGRALQTAELIEMQSILHDNLKQGMNTLFDTGTVLKGLELKIESQSNNILTLSINSGQIYLEGIVLEVPASTISVANTGSYTIGVVVNEQIITEQDDPNLRDPIKGGAVYGLEGAARLIWSVSLEVDNPSAFTIGKVVEGGLVQQRNNIFSKLDGLLAESTYERLGNFCVSGYNIDSLPSSSRVVADQTKYNALKGSLAAAEANSQQATNDANGALASLNTLQDQLNTALEAQRLTPSTANNILVTDLTNRVVTADAYYGQLAKLSVSKQLITTTAQSQLEANDALLIDKVLFRVSPGVAYVEGYRLNLSSPTSLAIPKELDTTTIEATTFTYSGSAAVTQRQFSIAALRTLSDILADNTKLIFKFNKLIYLGQFIDIQAEFNLSSANTSTSLSELLTFIAGEFNKVSTPDTSVNFQSALLNLTSIEIRNILKNNLIISQKGADSLLFTSTSITVDANQINIDLLIKGSEEPSSRLLVDVNTSNLAGGGRTNSFQLGFRPVAEIISLTATLEENLKAIVRGSTPGTSDPLGDSSIFLITKVIQGSKIYIEGLDYKLTKQSEIDWSLSGTEPAVGTTYYVSFLYTQPLAFNQDFILDATTDSISFIGNTPAPNQTFTVSYSYYLAKAGLITLDKEGTLSYILSDSASDPVTPTAPPNLLPLASFKLFANGATLAPTDCKVIRFSEMQQIAEQVRRNTSNIEVLNLNTTGYRKALVDIGSNPVGIYTDTIQDLSRLDHTNVNFTGALSATTQGFSAGYLSKDIQLRYVGGGYLASDRLAKPGFVTLPYASSREVLAQNRLSKTRKLGVSVTKARGQLYLSPTLSFLNAGASLFTPCDLIANQTSIISRTSSARSGLLQTISTLVKNFFKAAVHEVQQSFFSGMPLAPLNQDTSFLAALSNQVTSQNNKLTLLAINLPLNSEGYRIYIAGKEVKTYTRLGGTPLSVTFPGAMKVRADGSLQAELDLPPLKPGVALIEIIGPNGYCRSKLGVYNNLLNQTVLSALNNWDNIPIQTKANTILPLEEFDYSDSPLTVAASSISSPSAIPETQLRIDTLSQQYPVTHNALTQTFEVPDYYYLTQVKLKLKAIGVTGSLKVNLRGADDLGPTKLKWARATANSLQPSIDGSTWTTFTFDYPVLLSPNQTYSLALEVDAPNYEVFTAESGAPDLLNGSLLGNQLYLKGKLYSSEDGLSLNTYEYEDLTYAAQVANFSTTETIIDLGSYGSTDSFLDICFFALNLRDIAPPLTSLTYEYKVDTAWIAFQPNLPVCLATPANAILLRVKLLSSSPNVSPQLPIQGSSLSLYSNKTSSAIISNRVTYGSAYNNVTVALQYLKPTGANIAVHYSPTDGSALQGQEWFEVPLQTESFLDEGIGLIEGKFTSLNLVGGNYLGLGRRLFRYRITTTATTITNQALIKNVITYVW